MNYMNEVAKLLGVKLDEPFYIEKLQSEYKLTERGMMIFESEYQEWKPCLLLQSLIVGEYTIDEHKEQILTGKEREYLRNIIKPFKDEVKYIAKFEAGENEFIDIGYNDDLCPWIISLPGFKKDTRYKGMKTEKKYTLEELEL